MSTSGARILWSGLTIAAVSMLFAETLLSIVLQIPGLLLFAAPVTVAFLLTVGAAVAWFTARVSRSLGQRRAALAFFAAGFVAGGLWSLPVVIGVLRVGAEAGGFEPAPGAAAVAALFIASVTGFAAFTGRYLGPVASTRPRIMAGVGFVVLSLAVTGGLALSGALG